MGNKIKALQGDKQHLRLRTRSKENKQIPKRRSR